MMSDIVREVYKKLLIYDICGVKVNEDGSTTWLHSDRYMDEHPERTSQECTFDEIFNENTVKYMLHLINKTNG